MPSNTAEINKTSIAKTDIERRFAFHNEISVCMAPENKRKLNLLLNSTWLKSIVPVKIDLNSEITGNTIPVLTNKKMKKSKKTKSPRIIFF